MTQQISLQDAIFLFRLEFCNNQIEVKTLYESNNTSFDKGDVSKFCFPEPQVGQQIPFYSPNFPCSFSFVLTNGDGERYFGYSLNFLHPSIHTRYDVDHKRRESSLCVLSKYPFLSNFYEMVLIEICNLLFYIPATTSIGENSLSNDHHIIQQQQVDNNMTSCDMKYDDLFDQLTNQLNLKICENSSSSSSLLLLKFTISLSNHHSTTVTLNNDNNMIKISSSLLLPDPFYHFILPFYSKSHFSKLENHPSSSHINHHFSTLLSTILSSFSPTYFIIFILSILCEKRIILLSENKFDLSNLYERISKIFQTSFFPFSILQNNDEEEDDRSKIRNIGLSYEHIYIPILPSSSSHSKMMIKFEDLISCPSPFLIGKIIERQNTEIDLDHDSSKKNEEDVDKIRFFLFNKIL